MTTLSVNLFLFCLFSSSSDVCLSGRMPCLSSERCSTNLVIRARSIHNYQVMHILLNTMTPLSVNISNLLPSPASSHLCPNLSCTVFCFPPLKVSSSSPGSSSWFPLLKRLTNQSEHLMWYCVEYRLFSNEIILNPSDIHTELRPFEVGMGTTKIKVIREKSQPIHTLL